jgi:hypothetical protein
MDDPAMKREGWVAFVGALLLALPLGWSDPPPAPDRTESTAAAAQAGAISPAGFVDSVNPGGGHGIVQISFGPAVAKSERLKVKLRAAYFTAVDRLRRGMECRALFVPLEADGVEMLMRSVYARANAGMEATWCRHAVAGTSVGKSMVFLCRRFATLPVEEAATILIHEALHRAGMSESPLDRGCMTGDAISEMVRRACFRFDDADEIRVASTEPDRIEDSMPTDPAGTVPSAVRVARAGPVLTPQSMSRFIDVVDMRSSFPY